MIEYQKIIFYYRGACIMDKVIEFVLLLGLILTSIYCKDYYARMESTQEVVNEEYDEYEEDIQIDRYKKYYITLDREL